MRRQSKNDFFPRDSSRIKTGVTDRVWSGICERNRGIWKCHLHFRKQCEKQNAGRILRHHAKIKLYRLCGCNGNRTGDANHFIFIIAICKCGAGQTIEADQSFIK